MVLLQKKEVMVVYRTFLIFTIANNCSKVPKCQTFIVYSFLLKNEIYFEYCVDSHLSTKEPISMIWNFRIRRHF